MSDMHAWDAPDVDEVGQTGTRVNAILACAFGIGSMVAASIAPVTLCFGSMLGLPLAAAGFVTLVFAWPGRFDDPAVAAYTNIAVPLNALGVLANLGQLALLVLWLVLTLSIR